MMNEHSLEDMYFDDNSALNWAAMEYRRISNFGDGMIENALA